MRTSSRASSRSPASSCPTASRRSSRAAPDGLPAVPRGRLSFDRRLLERPTLEAARALIGARLVRDDADDRRVGRIVEVEAYIGTDDLASHARFGETARNRVMFGPPGIAYVYLVYGMYCCLNVVTEPSGRPAAVLVRAIEPIEGVEAMREARVAWLGRRRRLEPAAMARERERVFALPEARLASGPGLAAAAMSIERSDTGLDLCLPSSPLRLHRPPPDEAAPELVAGPRVGIRYAGEPWTRHPWRFALAGNPAVSAPSIRG